MSAYSEMSETRKAQIKAGVEKNRQKLRSMPPAAAACWKIRASLTGEPDPYTPAERKRAEAIHAEILRLEAKAMALHAEVLARLSLDATPDAEAIRDAIATAPAIRAEFLF